MTAPTRFVEPVDSPVSVVFSPDTGELEVEFVQMHPTGGQLQRGLHFSAAATRELVLALKLLEKKLGRPIEDLSTPGSVQ